MTIFKQSCLWLFIFIALFIVVVVVLSVSTGNSIIERTTEEKKEGEEVVKKIIIEEIPFETKEEDDPSLEKGKTTIKQEGKVGSKEVTYKITYQDEQEVSRKEVSEKTVTKPIDKIVLIGTKGKEAETTTAENENSE